MNRHGYNQEPGESEFCHGPGLEPEQYKGLPPAQGGRYRGTTPPADDAPGRELPT